MNEQVTLTIPSSMQELLDAACAQPPGDHCTGQDEGCENRAIVLFPFEHIYLREKLSEGYKFAAKGVEAGNTCPYKDGNSCTIANHKPVACRMSPVEIETLEDKKLRVLLKIRQNKLSDNLLHRLIDQWTGIIVAMWKHLPVAWWKDHNLSIPQAAYRDIGTMEFELEEDKSPIAVPGQNVMLTRDQLINFVDPNCTICDQSGMVIDPETSDYTACDCIRKNFWEAVFQPPT